MVISRDGIQGTCHATLAQTDSQISQTPVEVCLFLNLRTQMLLVRKPDVDSISRLTFREIDLVEPCEGCQFRMAVKGNPEKILTCANEAEKD